MLAGMPSLSHEEQQEAVERIHQFMSEGMSSGEAIALVAAIDSSTTVCRCCWRGIRRSA